MIGLVVWKLRQPKPDRPTTWAEAIAGAVYVFALFLLMYAVVPHEFITVLGQVLEPLDVALHHQVDDRDPVRDRRGTGRSRSTSSTASATRSSSCIYIVFFGLNIALFVLWQKRPTVSEAAESTPVPAGRSRFGRPLKAKA